MLNAIAPEQEKKLASSGLLHAMASKCRGRVTEGIESLGVGSGEVQELVHLMSDHELIDREDLSEAFTSPKSYVQQILGRR